MQKLKKQLLTASRSFGVGGGQEGVAILFTTMIMSVILAISLGLSAIFIQENQIMTEIGYSVVAFYAADAGIEKAMMASPPDPMIEGSLPENGATFVVLATPRGTGNCPSATPNYCIKSVGNYKTVRRAIQIIY